jgi:hypothetical protein
MEKDGGNSQTFQFSDNLRKAEAGSSVPIAPLRRQLR